MSIKSNRIREARNRPPADKPWIWLTREMIESDAWRSLSRQAQLVIDRVMIEHMLHAGTENGNLVVTYADFEKFGIRRMSLKAAIAEAVATGLLTITLKGRPSVGPDRWPTRYALGWLPLRDGAAAPNRWKAWCKPSPIPGNIESSSDSATRENGRKPRSLVAKTLPGKKTLRAVGGGTAASGGEDTAARPRRLFWR
jgi:hypothetical protein